MSFELLSESIRRFIREKRWESLRPIQIAAIKHILTTQNNCILVSRTASGKTEAAFLPVLSKVDFHEKGVQVLYIAPLIALINDQFTRVEDLCRHIDIRITKWHGEASQSQKKAVLGSPSGIILITPESLEALFVHKPFQIKALFSNLKFIIIDEIHSFLGTDRGIQLQSIISRLQQVNLQPARVIGLSATIGEYNSAKKLTGRPAETVVLLDPTSKETEVIFKYYEQETLELPAELIEDLYVETKDNKVLVFPNSRGRAEEIAVKLHRIAQRLKGHDYYFSHHSSVDKEVRQYVEHFAKNNKRYNFLIACTSTLELGIDIGSVDEVVQIDATFSISSLIQRVGRSGRRGDTSRLLLYSTDPWSLLQSIACWNLYKQKFIEPVKSVDLPYDIMLHQILSIIKSRSGISQSELMKEISLNSAFQQIPSEEIKMVIDHLCTTDFIEKLGQELIIGVTGEWVVNSRDFYSVFETAKNLKVICASNTIGELPMSPQLIPDENIFLAARIWKIVDVDEKALRVTVTPAKDGKKPLFGGSGGSVHPRIRQEMLAILVSHETYPFLSVAGTDTLNTLRESFTPFGLTNIATDTPLKVKGEYLEWYSFTGSRINYTLLHLLKSAGLKSIILKDDCTCFKIPNVEVEHFMKVLQSWTIPAIGDEVIAEEYIKNNPSVIENLKWGKYLPFNLQVKLVLEKSLAIADAVGFLKKTVLKTNILNKD